jgi:hypothetical protein
MTSHSRSVSFCYNQRVFAKEMITPPMYLYL